LTAKKPRIATVGVIATLMREGGHSSKSSRRIIDVNLQLMSMYAARSNVVVGAVAVAVKVVYKMLSAAYFNVVRIERRSLEV